VTIGFIYSMYLAGRLAERRGRSFKVWAWIAAIIGPLALPLMFLFKDLHRKNGDHA
jgi:MFS family permease